MDIFYGLNKHAQEVMRSTAEPGNDWLSNACWEWHRENEVKLMEALSADDQRPIGTPILARYNSPFTPWFMRRNEVMVRIEWREAVEPDSVE